MSQQGQHVYLTVMLELARLLCYGKSMKTVLIVDDDEVIRLELARTLGDAGFKVVVAADGAEGFAKAESLKPDLIVLDQDMPNLYGQEVLEAVRASAWGKELPIIGFTISDDVTLLNQNLQAGITQYFDKSSITAKQMAEIIQEKLQ